MRPAYLAPSPSILGEGRGEGSAAEGPIIPGWSLTIAERKRILIDHLHGVDLDDILS